MEEQGQRRHGEMEGGPSMAATVTRSRPRALESDLGLLPVASCVLLVGLQIGNGLNGCAVVAWGQAEGDKQVE